MSSATARVRSEINELSLLFEISQILDRSIDLRDELGPFLKAIAKHTGMLRGTITLVDRETGDLYIEAAQIRSNIRHSASHEAQRGVVEIIARQQEHILLRTSRSAEASSAAPQGAGSKRSGRSQERAPAQALITAQLCFLQHTPIVVDVRAS